jgi:hypothetical protein
MPDSSVSVVSGYGLNDRVIQVQSTAETKFPVTSVTRPDLWPTQSPVQWVPGVLSPGLKRCRGINLTTHPPLVPTSRMSRAIPPLFSNACMTCSGTALAKYGSPLIHTTRFPYQPALLGPCCIQFAWWPLRSCFLAYKMHALKIWWDFVCTSWDWFRLCTPNLRHGVSFAISSSADTYGA